MQNACCRSTQIRLLIWRSPFHLNYFWLRKTHQTSNPGCIVLCFINVHALVYFGLVISHELLGRRRSVFATQTPLQPPLQPPLAGSWELSTAAANFYQLQGALSLKAGSWVWRLSKNNSHRQPSDGVWNIWRSADTASNAPRPIFPVSDEANVNKTAGNIMHFWRYFLWSAFLPNLSIHPSIYQPSIYVCKSKLHSIKLHRAVYSKWERYSKCYTYILRQEYCIY